MCYDLCLHMCVCECAAMCVDTHVLQAMCRGQRISSDVTPHLPPCLTGFLLPLLHMPVYPWPLQPISSSVGATNVWSDMGFGHLNSGPHTCVAISLPTELSLES